MTRKLLRLAMSIALLTLAACGEETQTPDAGTQPGADACTPACDGKQCGPNGCGGTCGSCGSGSSCNLNTGVCAADCTPESNPTFCTRVGKNCGSVTGTDNCGKPRTTNCGTCSNGEVCPASNVCPGTCMVSEAEFCAAQNKECGAASGTDTCGASRNIAECGPCLGGQTCSAAGQCEGACSESDAEFCTRKGAVCGELSGLDACGQSKAVLNCGTCGNGQICTNANQCATPQANDTCGAGVIELVPDATGHVQATGDTTSAIDDADSFYCAGPGNDLVYKLVLATPKAVNITLTPGSPDLDVILRANAGACDPADELICEDSASPGSPEIFANAAVPAGTYFLWVDSAESGGPFTLDVQLSAPPAPPNNDQCATAATLDFQGASTVTVTGDTTSAADDYVGTCGTWAPTDGGDAVWKLHLDSDKTVRATVTTTTSNYYEAVYIRNSNCESAAALDEVACDTGGEVTVKRLPAGDYYVIVDGTYGTYVKGGQYSLTVELTDPPAPPPNDSCATAAALDFQGGSSVTVTGDTGGALNDSMGTCGGGFPMTGGDAVYVLQLQNDQAVHATLTSPDPDFDTALYLRKACDSAAPADEVACALSAELNLRRVPQGTYYLIVDGSDGTGGPFSLTVDLSAAVPAPTNDTCSSPIALTAGTPVTGDTSGAVSEYGNSAGDFTGSQCVDTLTGGNIDGEDLVYSYTTASGNFTVTLTPGAGFDAALWITAPTCGAAAECVDFADVGYDAEEEKLTVTGAPGATYSIIVDSWMLNEAGPFTLAVSEP